MTASRACVTALRASPLSQTAYAVLSHLRLLAHRAPVLFCGSYKSFFCRYNDPSYVKSVKLDILCAIADSSNAFDIVTEICEYVADVNVGEGRGARERGLRCLRVEPCVTHAASRCGARMVGCGRPQLR